MYWTKQIWGDITRYIYLYVCVQLKDNSFTVFQDKSGHLIVTFKYHMPSQYSSKHLRGPDLKVQKTFAFVSSGQFNFKSDVLTLTDRELKPRLTPDMFYFSVVWPLTATSSSLRQGYSRNNRKIRAWIKRNYPLWERKHM